MTDQDSTNMVEEDALAAGWSLMDDDADVESITSDDSSTTDFIMADLAKEDVRVVPIADYHDLVMVEIPSADSAAAKLVDLESDAEIVHIDEVTDDNLDDWVTTEMENRRRQSGDSVPKTPQGMHQKRTREDDESSECSAGSSESSSWTAESVHEAVVDEREPEDHLPAPAEELPSDYPQGYRSSIRSYAHQRNNDANNCLTILLFVVLTVVSAVAFGHFRGTTVVTRHSPHGLTFDSIPTTTSNILSDIQKDQLEILKQLHQMLSIQVELKQRIVSLEEENKDLRLRLLENRKRCTRILHRSSSAAEASVNISDDGYGRTVEQPSGMKSGPIFEFHRQPIDLPLSLSAVVRAKTAAQIVRTNFQPVEPPFPVEQKSQLPLARPRPEDLKPSRSAFRAVPDRYLKIAKEQVDFVMIDDIVVPMDRLLGVPQKAFGPSPPMEPPIDLKISRDQENRQLFPDGKVNLAAQSKRLFDRNWAYSQRSKNEFSAPYGERTAKRSLDNPSPRLPLQATHQRYLDVTPNEKEIPINEHLATASKARHSDNNKSNTDDSKADLHQRKPDKSEDIKAKIDIVRADIRREKNRIKSARRKINESTSWGNTSDRVHKKSHKREKKEHKPKYSSSGTTCKDGKSTDEYCFLKPNKYRQPEKEACKSHFWNSLPNFIKNHFARTQRLEKVFRGLGTDIVRSKVFKKIMEEVPKKFKMSSEWLDCQWKWWQNFARRQSRSSYGDCGDYLTSWQHKNLPKKGKNASQKSRETREFSRKSRREDFRKESANVLKDMLDTNESNWFFRRASDRAELRNTIISAGRRMGNLTSWFFQRAKDREQQRSRFLRDEVTNPGGRHSQNGRIPSDPIYEFLKHRASWRRTGGQHDFSP